MAYLPVPKLERAISCSENGVFATWDLRCQGALPRNLYAGAPDPAGAVRFDGKQRILAFTQKGRLLCWDSASSGGPTVIAVTPSRFSNVRFLNEGTFVSAIDDDRRALRVLHGDTLRDAMTPFPLPWKPRAYYVSPELQLFAVIGDDGALNAYNWKGEWLFGRGGIAASAWPTITIGASRREIVVTSEKSGTSSRTSFFSVKDGHEIRDPIEGKQFGHLPMGDDYLCLVERSGNNTNRLVVWEREGAKRTREIQIGWQLKAPMWALTDRVIAVQGWGNIEIWDVKAAAFRSYVSATNTTDVQDIAVDRKGAMAAFCAADGSVSAKEIRLESDAFKDSESFTWCGFSIGRRFR